MDRVALAIGVPTPTLQDEFPAVESFSVATRRIAFHTAEAHEGKKGFWLKPPLVMLGLENLHEVINLLPVDLLLERHKQAGLAHVAIVFWNLVLQNQMVAEGIPSKFRNKAVILVRILAAGG